MWKCAKDRTLCRKKTSNVKWLWVKRKSICLWVHQCGSIWIHSLFLVFSSVDCIAFTRLRHIWLLKVKLGVRLRSLEVKKEQNKILSWNRYYRLQVSVSWCVCVCAYVDIIVFNISIDIFLCVCSVCWDLIFFLWPLLSHGLYACAYRYIIHVCSWQVNLFWFLSHK